MAMSKDELYKIENEETRKAMLNMREYEEKDCESKRSFNPNFACSKQMCDFYNTPRCLHPKKADTPTRYW